MDLIFIAPSTRHPSGGVAMTYEFAGAMAARGHRVHLYHVEFFEANATGLDDIDWFTFAPGIEHHFPAPGPPELDAIPDADFIFGFSADAPPRIGLPVVLIQGHDMLAEEVERAAFRAPCPKVCVAGWLVEVGRGFGTPEHELVHIPLGLRHEKYRLTRPVADRPPTVSCCYSPHLMKGSDVALEVLARVRAAVPELEAVMFGAVPPIHDLPEWVTYRLNPSQDALVDEVYNTSRVFLCASRVEGFGLTNIEAMAGGAALVTTDNGGSDDYARDARTALVAPVGDVAGLAARVVALLGDDEQRIRIASAGRKHVRQFSWPRSAAHLEAFLEQYRADPAAYGRRREERTG
jgi:glycosyltransferase involved in cell wall biosynthesis